ncbi:LysR family transcriptional regulator [Paracoccus sp. R12_1]|uniref:LysR family transcriptional regulator n=1 Tax=unclassified Paracoccus (in: a-proteobacteria) TaxID=2688777 RepID=UPI001ADBE314|nr:MULTISPECIES: LysR family transcriptional regulator [unclassified Paracoccus (in: a-proteobacteria)]MBO9457023.1 LysR family transcriptional regulator [Paracoccus sp. R12_2]MBO9488092.1 LysR family transcriptional regulator [Paracoccus sp. R12_1]
MSEGDLGFFVLLAQRGSFVATAREMGVTASAVSRRLARLEDRLGVRLMNRTTRRVSLTGEGEAYFTKAARLLAEIEDLESSLRAGRDTPSGLLRINATFGFSRQHIAPVIQEYCATYSGIDVQLVVTDAPMNLVEQGVDLNIRFGDPPTSNLVQRLLQRNRRFMCASPEYLDRHGTPASLQDLGRHDCIVLRQEHDLYDVWRFDDLGRQSPSARVGGRLSTNDGDIAREWMLGGRGIMLRSEWDIARHVRQGRLRVVLPDYCQTANIAAIYPERHHLAAKVRVFVDLLAERIRASDAHDPMQLTAAELRPR